MEEEKIMTQVMVYDLSPGMILAQDVQCPDTNALLLKEGSKITDPLLICCISAALAVYG